jgi:ABC-type lipoprotein export system ATPase subunit
MSAAVELRDAFRIFGSGARASVALQGLTLAVEREEVVVVLGPSGSGKTTLLRVAAGLEPLSAGSVHILGVDLEHLNRRELNAFRAATLGFLDQHYARALSPDLSIRQTVALELLLRGVARREALAAADELLDRVGLLGRGHDRRVALSGGEQQRVAVCAAVAHRPRLLIVDEPAGELDAENAAIVYDLLAELAREAHAAALIVSHDPDAARIADRLVHVRDGRVGAEGEITPTPAASVSTRPTAASGDVVAELRGVHKAYQEGPPVLRGLSVQVGRGRLLAVVGRSGTGKTTLLHLLAGLEWPSEGEVLLGGELLDGRGREELAAIRRKSVSIVTQEPGLVPHLSARENVLLALSVRGIGEAARADTALAEVGLACKNAQRAALLSAGERQRVAIARALASGSPILLADEPTARLDEENAARVGRLLARAARVHGLAVVCATHDPGIVRLADEVVRLDARTRLPSPAGYLAG